MVGPGFPVEFDGVGEVPAVPAGRDRTRGRVQRSVQEIRGLRLLVCLPLFLSFCLAAQNLAPVITVDHGPNATAQQAKPYVVMVSLDGFRYDYAKKYHAK